MLFLRYCIKTTFSLTLFLFVILLTAYPSIAEEKEHKFSVEGIYNHFETLSIKNFFQHVQKAALWLSVEGEYGIEEINKPYTKWNYMDAMSPYFCVIDCEKSKLIAHPNPSIQWLLNKQDLFKNNKDKNGKLWILVGCNKINEYPKGFWLSQYTTFERNITGLAERLYIQTIFIQVPNSSMQIVGFFPVRSSSITESEQITEKLNSMVETWSIKEFNAIYKYTDIRNN